MTTEMVKHEETTDTLAVATAQQVVATPVAPKELYRQATDVAGICGEIVKKTAKVIGRRKYVCIEGWQAIATTHGCCLSIDSVTEDEVGNVTSMASVRRMADGAVLAHAEGFVGVDEPTWKSRARYARRAMSQTRAMSRAARAVFAHVVVLIDSGLSTTPAEEVPDDGFDEQRPQTSEPRKTQTRKQEAAVVPGADMTTDEVLQYQERIDQAFKARKFDVPEADATQADVLKKYKLPNIKAGGKEWCEKFIEAINAGKFDNKKPVPAESAA